MFNLGFFYVAILHVELYDWPKKFPTPRPQRKNPPRVESTFPRSCLKKARGPAGAFFTATLLDNRSKVLKQSVEETLGTNWARQRDLFVQKKTGTTKNGSILKSRK